MKEIWPARQRQRRFAEDFERIGVNERIGGESIEPMVPLTLISPKLFTKPAPLGSALAATEMGAAGVALRRHFTSRALFACRADRRQTSHQVAIRSNL